MSEEDEVKLRIFGSINSVVGESGIDVDGEDDGGDYIDDLWVDFLFFFCEGKKLIVIEMSGVGKVFEVEVLIKG